MLSNIKIMHFNLAIEKLKIAVYMNFFVGNRPFIEPFLSKLEFLYYGRIDGR